jgi:hypothetical protein
VMPSPSTPENIKKQGHNPMRTQSLMSTKAQPIPEDYQTLTPHNSSQAQTVPAERIPVARGCEVVVILVSPHTSGCSWDGSFNSGIFSCGR